MYRGDLELNRILFPVIGWVNSNDFACNAYTQLTGHGGKSNAYSTCLNLDAALTYQLDFCYKVADGTYITKAQNQ